MTVRRNFVVKKIERTKSYLAEARELLKLSNFDILHSSGKLYIAERLLQLIVDAVLDVNNHLIKELGFDTADDFVGTFEILGKNNVLEKEFALKIGQVVGLRNRIVHQYETVDSKKFLDDFRQYNVDFDEYFRSVLSFLDKGNF